MDPPVDWDTGRVNPRNSSDAGEEEEGTVLYNVSSLTSIIDRYEGKLMRKQEMESWSRRALKRLACTCTHTHTHTHTYTHTHTHTHTNTHTDRYINTHTCARNTQCKQNIHK